MNSTQYIFYIDIAHDSLFEETIQFPIAHKIIIVFMFYYYVYCIVCAFPKFPPYYSRDDVNML